MKKTKLLLLSLLTLASSSMWGQSWADVTDTYLDNADFTADDAISVNLCGYSADASKEDNKYNGENALYWAQDVTDWTVPYTKADGNAGAIFAYGSDQQMRGNKMAAPATNPEGGNSGKALGIFAVWTGTVKYIQNATLPAGHYKFQYTYYNQSGTGTITNYCGFIPQSGTASYASNTTFSTGEWKTVEFEFTLSAETEGQISLGYKAPNSGSGACPMLFIDNVKLFFDNTVDKTNLDALITKAEGLYSAFGVGAVAFKSAIDAAKAVSVKVTATIAEVLSTEETLKAAIKTYHIANPSEEHPYDMTDEIGNIGGSITGWTSTTGAKNNVYKTSTEKNNGEYTATGFIENWNANNFTGKISYTLKNLHAGHYRVSAYAFDSPKSGSVYFYANDKEVVLDNSTDLFTNPTLTDVLVGEHGIMELGLNIKEANTSWVGITNIKLEYIGVFTDEDKITAAKAELLAAIESRPAPTANIGNGAFQYSASAVEAYSKALVDAQGVYDNASATLAEVNEAIASLAFPTLNSPKANTRYALVLKYNEWDYDNKAVTYIADGRSDAGNYNIQYLQPVNVNYAQAFIFTLVEGDKYKLSQIDADGEERFVCTGVVYGGSTAQIRTTTDASKALVVEVRATATEGKWNLRNTEADQFIGSQDAGFFTVNSHIDFEIAEAKEIPGISVPAVGYATYIAPADVTIPSGVKAYSCDGAEGTTLVLTEVTNTIPKDKPVILIAAGGYSDDTTYGYSNMNPKSETFTEGPLVGTYVDMPAPAGSYVLQNGSEGAKFYKVSDEAGQQPTVKANHVYLNFPASEVKAFALEEATGINFVNVNENVNENMFNLNGVRVNDNYKGIVIKNGKKQLNK